MVETAISRGSRIAAKRVVVTLASGGVIMEAGLARMIEYETKEDKLHGALRALVEAVSSERGLSPETKAAVSEARRLTHEQ